LRARVEVVLTQKCLVKLEVATNARDQVQASDAPRPPSNATVTYTDISERSPTGRHCRESVTLHIQIDRWYTYAHVHGKELLSLTAG
jgi:hypothetical protein